MKFEFSHLASTASCVHVKVMANNKEVGILYLNNEELDALLDLIRKGISSSSVEFINNISVDDGADDLED
jgi:hypothetical protein